MPTARACLLHLAGHPYASNRQIGRAVGIERHTHISTLLARLAELELVHKRSRTASNVTGGVETEFDDQSQTFSWGSIAIGTFWGPQLLNESGLAFEAG